MQASQFGFEVDFLTLCCSAHRVKDKVNLFDIHASHIMYISHVKSKNTESCPLVIM